MRGEYFRGARGNFREKLISRKNSSTDARRREKILEEKVICVFKISRFLLCV